MDCGDKICDVRYQLVPTCIYYVFSNNSNCDIPCNLEGCLKEIRLNFVCPIWQCEEKVTTTTLTPLTTTSISSTTTAATTSPIPNNDFGSLNIFSLVGNVTLALLLAIFLLCFKHQIIQTCTRTKNDLMSRFRRNNYRHSPTENIPLRSARFSSLTSNVSLHHSSREQSQPRNITQLDPFFSIASSDEAGSGFSEFVNVNLDNESRFLTGMENPDSIEAAIETAATRASGATSLNESSNTKSFKVKRSTKNLFSKRFWKKSHS